ncbi:MAG: hypothetical protein DMF66_20080, partial [Acidobacteria bacterium]
LCLKVSYYKAMVNDARNHDAACEEFDAKSWLLLSAIRTEISKAKRLTSGRAYRTLNDLYDWLNGVDTELSGLTLKEPGQHSFDKKRKEYAPRYAALGEEKWVAFHKTLFFEGGKKIDDVLALVARDMGLTASGSEEAGGDAGEPEKRFLEMIEQEFEEKSKRGLEEKSESADRNIAACS